MKLPTPEIQQHIEDIISTRFHSSIDYAHVLRWLDNFADEEQDMAIKILSLIRYYSYDEILSVLNTILFEQIKVKTKKQVFISIGESGKSGDSMLYIVQQILRDKGLYANNIAEALKKRINGTEDLVLVDDILGSGKTTSDWLKEEIINPEYGKELNDIIAEGKVSILSIGAMDRAIVLMSKNFPTIQVYGERGNKAFLHSGSVFGGSVTMIAYRELCYKYGAMLCPKAPLGFGNSQCLIVFSHSTPNNTVPIIWSNKSIGNKRWTPLFPRFASDRIKINSLSMTDSRKQLILLRELFRYDSVTKDLLSSTNIYLLKILNLKTRRIDDFAIGHILGVSTSILESLWRQGEELGLWDNQHNLTLEAIKEYKALLKKIKYQRSELRRNESFPAMTNDIIYIPETFKGVK